jgi:hypothetical protein
MAATCSLSAIGVHRRHLILSAWESGPFSGLTCLELRSWLSESDRQIPVFAGVNGTLMARRRRPWASDLLRVSSGQLPGLEATTLPWASLAVSSAESSCGVVAVIFCCHRSSRRRWVMSTATRVSGISGGLWSPRWPRGTRSGTSCQSRRVSAVSLYPVASGLQIGLQGRSLTCDFVPFQQA